MSKNTSTVKRVSAKKDVISKASKQNIDTIYLLQNQNQVLKIKNLQMQQKISSMKSQLISLTSSLAQDQQQCQRIRMELKHNDITDDIRLQGQKKRIQDKIQLLRGNCEIVARKIQEVRQAAIIQQDKLPNIKQQKTMLERTFWQQRTANEGTKVIMQNLQKQLQICRKQNSQMVGKRKQFDPKQSQISKLIESKLKQIKSRQRICNKISKQQSTQFIYNAIDALLTSRKTRALFLVEQFGYIKKIQQKNVFLLSLIRKKYLLFIKNKAMQSFRQSFKCSQELNICQNIIKNVVKRRAQNKIYLIWKSQFTKKQYTKTRYFQVQATLQKIVNSFTKSITYSCFNNLKYIKRNATHRKAGMTIERVIRIAYQRCKKLFLCALNTQKNNHLRNLQVQQSASQQSILLVLSVYFSAWVKLAKDNKTSNKFIKFKYFRQLKKLNALRKKRDLSEMLVLTDEKISQINKISTVFCQLKKQTIQANLQASAEQMQKSKNKNKQLKQTINQMNLQNKQKMGTFSLLKISKYLKKQVQKAFTLWRNYNNKLNKLSIVMNMLEKKMNMDLNLGFVFIQRRKFEKLKHSISDKIQSCEFSYNYLIKQNTHIKQVLDNKLLELQKSKFSNILRRLIKAQKEVKRKYLFKFLKNGYKYWRFINLSTRVDRLVDLKIKKVFIFLIKQLNKQKSMQMMIQNKTNSLIQRRQKSIQSLIFGIFQNNTNRNKRMKRILSNVFNRNLQLSVYVGYNKIKKITTQNSQSQVYKVNENVENKIKQANNQIFDIENNIQILRERLNNKNKSIKSRILLACRKIYIRNSSNLYMNYFNRWRNKLSQEKRINKFIEIVQRKMRILLKNKLANNLITKNSEQQVKQLKKRLENFTNQLNQVSTSYEKYVQNSQNQMKKMENQNQFHDQNAKLYQKRTDRMDDITVASFRHYWGKMMVKFCFREWKIHKKYFIDKWSSTFNLLQYISKRQAFLIISSEMRSQIIKKRIRKNLSYIYAKKFRANAGLAFKIWRVTSLNTKIKQSQAAYALQISNQKLVTAKYDKTASIYDKSVNERIGDKKMRKIFDFLKKYTRLKIDNNKNKIRLQKWLLRGYRVQFYRLFFNKFDNQVRKNRKADSFMQSVPKRKAKLLLQRLNQIVEKKKCFKKLFLNKFIHYSQIKIYQHFFTRSKDYYRYVQVTKKNHQTMCIQKVIERFDKKRKDILCKNIRIWRKNLYEINIGQKLFKRITRKAIYNRYQGMFYAWKLESQAKKVLKYHYDEGEVKKRKVEIKRIQKFLHQFKKDKGLLLENQQGNFVMSPRFQKKKQEQELKDKNLRYKFISRLIMSINNFENPIKGYNNILVYMKLRQKYRNTALFVLNNLRKPDVYNAFKVWKKSAAQFRQNFQNMERKELIKILNKQKDKMQMEYSRKISVDEKIQSQLSRYKIYSHQRDKKQKLCAYVFARQAKKVKLYAFQLWRQTASNIRDQQNNRLARKGQSRLQNLQEQIRELQQIEEELTLGNRNLKDAVSQALQIAEMVKKISQERDKLSKLILQKNVTCQSLVQENQILNSKLYLAQKQAIHLLVLSGQKP